MLTLKQLRDDKEAAVRRLAKKGVDARPVIDRIEQLDDRRKAIQQELDNCLSQQNQAAKMIGALMGRDLIRAAWVLGGFLVYQLSVSFLWHWYFERVYPQWKERLEYKLNRRLYRIMLDARL